MENQKSSPKYAPEVRERAVRMVFDHAGDYPSQWAAIASIAAKIGCSTQTLSNWVKQAERNARQRAGLTTDERERMPEVKLRRRPWRARFWASFRQLRPIVGAWEALRGAWRMAR